MQLKPVDHRNNNARSVSRAACALAAVASLAVMSCSPGGPTDPGFTAARITVSVTTTGSGAPSTYSVRLDQGAARTIDASGSTTFGGLAAGNYSVELLVPGNCTVAGGNPRAVGVQEASTATATFSVTCSSVPTGAIGLTTQTTGQALDPDGYSISVDGGAGRAIAVNGTLLLPDLGLGTHDVQISGVADNCMVQGDNPRTLTVTQNQTTQSTFDVVCSSTTGLVAVTVSTTGAELDPDGYTVDLDGVATQPVTVNGTTTFTGVEQGDHALTLQGVAANCTVADNPVQATVVAGQTVNASFSVTCVATSGGLTVSASTTGSEVDPNGYAVTVDGGPEQAIGVNGNTTFPTLTPGDHLVELVGVAANCAVGGSNPRTVTITAGAAASTTFSVACSSTVGSIQVNVTTTGSALDPDGYSVTLDGTSTRTVTTNGSTTFTGIVPGSHSLELQNIAANCTVSGANPKNTTVSAGATATVSFTVTCASLTGSIRVSMSTTGAELDPNGYTVTVDGSSSQSIDINGSRTFSGIVVGMHDVDVTGVATNCAVQGANPRTVTVNNNATTQVDIDVVCVATAGAIQVSVTTTGDDLDANGYTVSLDSGAQLGALTINGSVTFNGVAPGGHSLMLQNVASNCTVTSANPATANVTAGNTANVSFSVACTRTTGDIRVTASSTGSPSDANGYTVTVDGGMTTALPINGNVLFADLSAGSHSVEVSDVAATCTVSGSNPRNVTVTADAEAATTFTVTCAPLTGSVQVNVATTGVELDPDGYSVSLDGATSQSVATNGSTTFSSVVTGDHSLTLTGAAANCTVTSANPASTTVSQDATSTVNFTVSCAATTGSINVGVTTTGAEQDPDGYTVQLDAGTPQAIGINGSTSFTTVAPGSHDVTLAGLAANCTVGGSNPLTVTVSAGAASTADFEVSCTATTGTLRVTANSSGPNLDLNGYTVALDGGGTQPLAINGDTLTFSAQSPGAHMVVLGDVVGTCTITGGGTHTPTVTAGAETVDVFEVVCF